MLGARDALIAVMPKATVDAEVSRQALPTYQRLKDRIAAGKLAQVVVLHVGTNGPAYEKDLRAAVKNLSDRGRVVLVTAHMPDKWMEESNTSIRNVAKDFPERPTRGLGCRVRRTPRVLRVRRHTPHWTRRARIRTDNRCCLERQIARNINRSG